MLSLGFVTSCPDSFLFVYSHGNALLYFLVYVDDLIITRSNPSLVDTIIRQFDSKFSIKDLGVLSYFYGVEVLATSTSLLLSQQKYVIDPLSKHNMLGSKLVSTSLAVGTSLTAHDGTVLVNGTTYRQVVGDLIITGSGRSLVDTIIRQLNSKFSTKDLGALSYFCGVEVLATSTGLLLSPQKYVIDLMRKHNMLDSKSISTPLVVGNSSTAHDGIASVNATTYRQVVSGLQHLQMTRPDISFAINKLSQFMHAASEHH